MLTCQGLSGDTTRATVVLATTTLMAEKVAIEDTFEVPVAERRVAYETTLVLSAKAGEEAREALLGKIRGFIADQGGEIIEASPAKEYTLAYPIQKEQQGIMRTLVYRGDPKLPNGLADALRHDQALLRILTIGQPKRTPVRESAPFSPMPREEATATTESTETAVDTEKQDAQLDEAISNI